MRTITILPIVALALSTSVVGAQAPPRWTPEVRPFVGTAIPTGRLRDFIGSETTYGVQAAAQMRPWLHVLGTFGLAPAHTRYVAADDGLQVLTYDVGAEVNTSQPFSGRTEFHAFWGAGAGARTYLYDAPTLRDRTCLSGYVSTGGELQIRRIGLRGEARDNVFCHRPPIAGQKSGTRNELAFSLSLAWHFR